MSIWLRRFNNYIEDCNHLFNELQKKTKTQSDIFFDLKLNISLMQLELINCPSNKKSEALDIIQNIKVCFAFYISEKIKNLEITDDYTLQTLERSVKLLKTAEKETEQTKNFIFQTGKKLRTMCKLEKQQDNIGYSSRILK